MSTVSSKALHLCDLGTWLLVQLSLTHAQSELCNPSVSLWDAPFRAIWLQGQYQHTLGQLLAPRASGRSCCYGLTAITTTHLSFLCPLACKHSAILAHSHMHCPSSPGNRHVGGVGRGESRS